MKINVSELPYVKPDMPSQEYLRSKLVTRKSLRRNPRRQLRVLTDKLTRKHVRKLFAQHHAKLQQDIEAKALPII